MDPTKRHPVSGVVVLLVDRGDTAVARALSNERGEFRLVAPTAGSYLVRTLRIGFRPATSDLLQLANGQELTRDIDVSSIPFVLDTVKIVARNACGVRSGPDVASAIWEQARTALLAAQITARLRSIHASLVAYERVYDPGSSRIREQHSSIRSGLTTAAWKSLPADSLRRIGYVVENAQGWTTYYSPDVDVLLSPTFQIDHCFHFASAPGESLIGLVFEPARDRGRLPEIKGTLWLDAKTSELRRMEHRYVNVSAAQEDGGAGGQMEFVRMANGGFAISRWNIRMPAIQLRATGFRGLIGSASSPQPRVAEIRVAGGELIAVTLRGDTLWSRQPLVLAGTVTDSASGERIADARVAVSGTTLRGVTDARGRFAIPGVLPGEYTVEVQTPSLDSINAVHPSNALFTDATKPLELRVPRASDLRPTLCAGDSAMKRASPRGIVIGSVFLRGDSAPLRNVMLVAEWIDWAIRREGAVEVVEQRTTRRETRTDARGGFRLCGVPLNTAITITPETDSVEATPVQVRIPPDHWFARTQLLLNSKPNVRPSGTTATRDPSAAVGPGAVQP